MIIEDVPAEVASSIFPGVLPSQSLSDLIFRICVRDFADSVVGMVCQSVSGSISRHVDLCYVVNFV